MSTLARIEIAVMSKAWRDNARGHGALVRRVARTTLAMAGRGTADCEISVALMSDRQIRRLNHLHRGQDKGTNVLSFPAFPAGRVPRAAGVLLGDIAVAYETLAREAKAEHKTFRAHFTHLVAHGVLHLLGYDHDTERDALKMERLERKILRRLGVADPYAERAPAPRVKRPTPVRP
ncbi:MAG: rRNA maturation RNase YbeY [Rhodospirillaceae bacterium]|nr:rRNA maturation RNase YbeY [Rhodospirillaceae bacterium]